MALTDCPECGNEVSDTADQCPNCGYDLSSSSWFEYEGTGCFGCLSKVIGGFILFVVIIGVIENMSDTGHQYSPNANESNQSSQIKKNYSNANESNQSSQIKNKDVCNKITQVRSIEEMQKIIKQQGQKISVDGEWGPNTRDALGNVCGNDFADRVSIQIKQNTIVYGNRSLDFRYKEQGHLKFIDVRRVKEQYREYITGKVKNVGEEKWDYVQVTFKLYDSHGNAVGSAYANYGSSLYPGGTWKFKAAITNDNVAAWQFDSATGW